MKYEINLKTYTEACSFPGIVDPDVVKYALVSYCNALGIQRQIVQIERGWVIDDYPDIKRTILGIARDAIDALKE